MFSSYKSIDAFWLPFGQSLKFLCGLEGSLLSVPQYFFFITSAALYFILIKNFIHFSSRSMSLFFLDLKILKIWTFLLHPLFKQFCLISTSPSDVNLNNNTPFIELSYSQWAAFSCFTGTDRAAPAHLLFAKVSANGKLIYFCQTKHWDDRLLQPHLSVNTSLSYWMDKKVVVGRL